MPIYEFRCQCCDQLFEALVRPTSTTTACPSCQSDRVERQISSFAVSSDGTRHRNLIRARKDGTKTALEKAKADEEWLHHHDH